MNTRIYSLLICLFAALPALAQTHRTEIGLQTDNDSYMLQGSDRYYTDGIYLYFRQALNVKDSSQTALANKVLGFEIGQRIYNPQGGNVPAVMFIDRPLAGYLYAGATLNLLYRNESNLKLSAQFGIIGPASKAEQIQKWVHNTFGFYAPTAWEYQIENNIQLNLGAEYNKLLYRSTNFDVSAAGYGNLGTGFTGAGVGPLFRLGNFNQLFNSAATQSTAIVQNSAAPLFKQEVFFYYKPQINYVAYDATIQGGLGKDHNAPNSLEVTKPIEPVVFTNKVGVMFTIPRFVFDISANFRSKETKGMVFPQSWGSVTALYRFN